jgi:hypothetical protein
MQVSEMLDCLANPCDAFSSGERRTKSHSSTGIGRAEIGPVAPATLLCKVTSQPDIKLAHKNTFRGTSCLSPCSACRIQSYQEP